VDPRFLSTELSLKEVNLEEIKTVPYTPGSPLGNDQVAQGDTTTGIDGKPIAGQSEGLATNFGYNDSEDNGRGSPLLDPSNGSGINTNNPTIQGVALPKDVIENALGIPSGSTKWREWAPARNAAVYVYDTNNPNKHIIVPLVDIGPGSGPRSRGVVIDETHAVNQYFGGDGNRGYRIIPDYYKR
jgi:hypothetical protein